MRSLAFALVVLLGVATLGFCATLQRGDSSTDVQALQYLLIQAGYRITADGDFGPGTETAVKNFQSSRGLSATGVVYDSTLEKLYVTVQYGSTLRDAVKAVQVFLIDKFEYLDGGIDGSFGPATTAAAKEFQQDQGLTADGIVGPNTFKKFFNPGTGPVSTPPSSGSTGQYAQMIRGLAGVKLYDIHTDQSASAKASAHYTQSTPKYILQDAANGITPWTSCYGTAPCRQQTLSVTMLRNLYEIGNTYDMWITEIIGGSHSGSSKHYSGVAFDVNWFDGEKINMSSGKSAGLRLKQICKDRGATLALGPGDAGHDTHVHCEWKGAP